MLEHEGVYAVEKLGKALDFIDDHPQISPFGERSHLLNEDVRTAQQFQVLFIKEKVVPAGIRQHLFKPT